MSMVTNKPGLSDKDFNRWLDYYMETGKGVADMYTQMSPEQVAIIQTVKRSIARITRKNKS